MTENAKKWLWLSIMAFIAILLISVFFVLVHEIFKENETAIDYSILDYFKQHIIHSAVTPWMKLVTFTASGPVITAGYVVLLIYLFWKNRNDAFLKVLFIGTGSGLLVFFSKLYYQRARPLEPLIDPLKTFSFPSGHSALGMVFYGMLCYMIWRSQASKTIKVIISGLLITLIPLIGLSRVYLRAHFPSDVVGGYCISAVWLLFCYYIFRFKRTRLYTDKYFKWMD